MYIKVFAIAAALGLSGMLAACNDGANKTESTARPPTKPATGADWEKQVQARLEASSTRMTLLAEQQKLNPPKSAILTYSIAPNGQIKDIKVARSSGLPPFDHNALNFVATAGPLPPFSDDMPRQDMQRISVVTVAQSERRWFRSGGDDKEGLLE